MRRRAATRLLFGVGLALAAASPATAGDRLHLDSGGYIDASRWWIEGDTLVYEGPGGTVGIPRSMVVRIERDADPASAPGSTFNQAPARARGAREAVRPLLSAEQLQELRAAHEALERRDFDVASSHYLALVREVPELHTARVGYAVSEMALGHDGSALPVVLDGLVLDPERADLLEILGQLRYREERVGEALSAWREAFSIEPSDRLRDKILKAERELHVSRDFDFAASPHFTLRYDGEVDVDLADEVIKHLEDRFWTLTEAYHHTPTQPITVQLYARQAFRDVTRSPEWVGGLYDGKIRVPLGGLSRLTPTARSVLTHELTHALVHSKTRGNAPRWLQEGLAQIAEEKRASAADEARIAEQLRARPPETWSALEFSYPSALSLTRYLETLAGFDGLVDLLDLLGDGLSIDEALREVYGLDYAGVSIAWGETLQERPR